MQSIKCIECDKLLAMIDKGKVRPHIKAYCNKCFDRIFNDAMENLGMDFPPGWDKLFKGKL